MENYQSNSRKVNEDKKEPEKRVNNQIQGVASTKKKNVLDKMADVFVPDDISNVKSYIVKETTDILVTALKKCISNTVNRFLYGESGGGPNSNRTNGSSLSPSYRSYYEERNSSVYKPRVGSVYAFDEVEFRSIEDVEDAIKELNDIQKQYGMVRVADMYEVAKLSSLIRYTDNNYGWTDVRPAYWTHYVVDGEDRYILKMPRPLPL